MKRILIVVSVIALLLVATLVALPFLIPSSVYKAQIEKAATSALGREVTLLGDAKLSVFPVISARIDGAQVANPDGYEGTYMIEAGELKGSVKLWPLFTGKVEINQITLSDATVRLERLADGRANWEFGSATTSPDARPQDDTKDGSLRAGIARARLTNAAVFYIDRTTAQQYALTDFDASAHLTSLDPPFTSSGGGRFNGQAFEYDVSLDTLALLTAAEPARVEFDLVTIYGRVQYDGLLTLAETPVFDGRFDVNSATLGAALEILAPEAPINAKEIKSLNASGTISGPATGLALNFKALDLKATGLDLNYKGAVTLSDAPDLDGTIMIEADRAERLFRPGQPLSTSLAAIGKLDLTANITGAMAQPSFSNIVLKQRSGLLSTDYTGAFSLTGDQALNGALTVNTANLRALLASFDIVLPDGDKLNTFSLSGNTQGTLSSPALSDAKLALDDLQATGTLGADLSGTRPRIIADLSMASLDLTPLLGTGTEGTEPSLNQDWSDDPLALEGLRAVDATISIAAGSVIIDQITLTDALLKTRLDAGRFSATFRQDEDRPGFKAFDGNWSGDMVLDASRATPTLQIEALADSIAAQKMLDALTGFRSLKGVGDIQINLTSSGNSIKALVNDLDGKVEADLNNGALRGINLAKLVRDASNIQGLIASGDLSVTSFREAFSPDAETDFTSFISNLSFTNGVALITDLRLDNPVVGVTGSGLINLGARSIDIRLVPAIDASAQRQGSTVTLNNIPVPVRVHGAWDNIKFELDTAAVRAELTARARGAIADEITDQIGGELGGIIGGIVGGDDAAPAPDNGTETAPRSVEDEIKDRAIEGALGAIFGGNNPDEDED